MTYEEAIRKSAVSNQRQSASFHAAYDEHKSEGREILASMYSNWAAEHSAIASALMCIEGDKT